MDTFLNFVNKLNIPMTDEEASNFVDCGTSVSLAKGDIFLDYEDCSSKIAFVKTGLLEMSININGSDKIIDFIAPHTCAVDFLGYLLDKPSELQIRAALDSDILWFGKEDLQHLLAIDEKYRKIENYIIEQSHIESIRRLRWMYLSSKERYESFRKKYPDLTQQVPQYKIASFLNVTPEWLSKIRGHK